MLIDECCRACDKAAGAYDGTPVAVDLPVGLTIKDLHEIVAFWRVAGWTVDVDSSGRTLTLG